MCNKVVNRNQITAQFCVRCAYNTKPLRNLVRLQRRYAYHGYVHMKKIITQALLIALPYSFLVSVLFYTLTVNFFAVSPGEPSEIVYYGFDTVRHMIREYGLVNYLAGILPHYIFFGCSILIALIIQGIINGKPKNA